MFKQVNITIFEKTLNKIYDRHFQTVKNFCNIPKVYLHYFNK